MTFALRTRELFTAGFLSVGIAFAPQALAQETEQAPAAAETTDISEEKLESFVVAFQQVEAVKEDFTQQIESAASDEEQQGLRNEAGQAMLQAVEDTDGISVDEYNQVLRSAQNDPELAERLTQAIGQAQ
ncbi:DUF4168 domain-containing protein [Chelativorans sp. YIM 93263]|uniref:DUF4168 domain-containing protein n=1 Tax=Chelativorans sp. YIM 93263 TaxID=2906648 RepID=UPI002378342E|nr:DUF4168 domain-containing protein [Chelativorans sp. YIM 93263]